MYAYVSKRLSSIYHRCKDQPRAKSSQKADFHWARELYEWRHLTVKRRNTGRYKNQRERERARKYEVEWRYGGMPERHCMSDRERRCNGAVSEGGDRR